MKRMLFCLVLAGMLLLASQAAFAASDISVTVTLQQLGVSVTPTSWPIGTLAALTPKSTWVSGNAGNFTATNAGNVAQNIFVAASSTTPSGWTPSLTAPGTNVYTIGFGKAVSPYTSEPTYTLFTTNGALASSVAASGTVRFDLQFTAPAGNSTVSPQETLTVSLSATAS